jgi:hypothetical protein
MISQEPHTFRLSGLLSKTQAIVGFVLLILFLFPGSLAAASMKLLALNTGWAAYGNKLYWTYNNGADWTDITPVLPDVRREAIRSVHPPFFRDKSEGWTLVEYQLQQGGSPQTLETAYSVAHTVDSGATWSFTELTYPQLPEWILDSFAGPGNLFFLDSLHGWLDIAFAGNVKPGKLLATMDGGKSWNWVNSAGFSGPITFATLQDGWQLGYFGIDKLFVTHDGCNTWQEVSLPFPPQIGAAATRRFQGTPIFQDQHKGYLVVQYSGTGGGPSKLVVYSTSDTGNSWHLIKILEQAPEAAGAVYAIADSVIIVSTGLSSKNVSAASVPLNGGVSAVSASDRGVVALTFAGNSNGWMLTADNKLLATQDEGISWKDVSPPSVAPPLRKETVPLAKKGLTMTAVSPETLLSGSAPLAPSFGSNAHVSKHLGFDMSHVRSVTDMATWWKYSPYYDIYISV